jgi:hypothetical protein
MIVSKRAITPLIRYLLLTLLFSLTSSCGITRFSALHDYHRNFQAGTYVRPDSDAIPSADQSHPGMIADAVFQRMAASSDPDMVLLGRALAGIPDVNDGVTAGEAAALRLILETYEQGTAAERAVLTDLARENNGPYQFSGSLQGLVWMIVQGDFDRNHLTRLNREELLTYAWESLPRRITTPEDLLRFMTLNFSYVLDLKKAKTAWQFFKDKSGDCTEYSQFGAGLLILQGYEVDILLTRPTVVAGHVSIVYKDDDGYWLMDGSSATLARILQDKIEREGENALSLGEAEIYRQMRPYRRLFGPRFRKEDLVREYERRRGGPVPYKFVAYDEYCRFIEVYHGEAAAWWDF